MNILIAGNTGVIGSYLNKQDRFANSLVLNSKIVDLTSKEEIFSYARKIEKFNVLIFLVGLAHKKGKGQELDEFRRVNKQTLVNLLSILEEENKIPDKIIFTSTISVYGEKINQNVYNEVSDTKPFSPYAITKLEAEEYLLNNFSNQSWILRFAPVYASNFQLNINRRTKIGGWFYKVGSGSKKLSLCNLENIGSAVQGIIDDKVSAGIYNISDENEYSYDNLLHYVNAKWIVRIPTFLVKGLFYIGKMMNNIFLKENATKLISDNIFSSDKIRKYISLTASLNE
jgi:nucleoside-diphosphate-sugar epimerase